MSKYIKLYDAIMAMDEWFSEPITPTKILSDLPTIEVSEEELRKKYKDFYEQGKFDAWVIAQKVFNSTVTLYEAEDVAKQMTKG